MPLILGVINVEDSISTREIKSVPCFVRTLQELGFKVLNDLDNKTLRERLLYDHPDN
jgi:hypothetical protein